MHGINVILFPLIHVYLFFHIVQYMDFDYHDSYRRLMCSVRDAEYETCESIKLSVDSMVEQAKTLNFEGDLHYFLSEYSAPFTPPAPFQFTPFQGDDVSF